AHRTSLLNLIEKEANHAARTARDIAKSHVAEPDPKFPGKLLDAKLRDFFRKAHITGGLDGLIRRDVDEDSCAAFDRGLGDIPRAEHVVANGFVRVGFEQAYVLVRGRMEHNLRTMA